MQAEVNMPRCGRIALYACMVVAFIGILVCVSFFWRANQPPSDWSAIVDLCPELRLADVKLCERIMASFPERQGAVELVPQKPGAWGHVLLDLAPTASSSRLKQHERFRIRCELLSEHPDNEAKLFLEQVRGMRFRDRFWPLYGDSMLEDGGWLDSRSSEVAVVEGLSALELDFALHPDAQRVKVFLQVLSEQTNSVVSVQSITVKRADQGR